MKFTIPSSVIQSALSKAGAVIESKSSLPSFGWVSIKAGIEELVITTTNSTARLSIAVDADVSSAGVAVIPFGHLDSIIRGSSGSVEFEQKQMRLFISFGSIRAHVFCVDPGEFPDNMPDAAGLKYSKADSALFKKGLRCVYPAILDVVGREGIAQACLRGGSFYGATGSVLHAIDAGVVLDGDFRIPRDHVPRLMKVIPDEGDIYIASNLNTINVRGEGFECSSRVLESFFPTAEVISKLRVNAPHKLAFDKVELLTFLKMFLAYSVQGFSRTYFKIDGRKSHVYGGRDGEVSLQCDIVCNTKINGMTFCISPHFLIEALNCCEDGEVAMVVDSVDSPSRLELSSKSFYAVIALVRVEQPNKI